MHIIELLKCFLNMVEIYLGESWKNLKNKCLSLKFFRDGSALEAPELGTIAFEYYGKDLH